MRIPGRRIADQFAVDRRVLALACARMADGIGNSFLIIVIPLYVASDVVSGATFGLSEAMIIGIILSLFGFVNSSVQPLTGRFSDRLGRRKLYAEQAQYHVVYGVDTRRHGMMRATENSPAGYSTRSQKWEVLYNLVNIGYVWR
ncbi:major facilitator superfamily protein [Natronolimnohabitans innermongolicus JCM 12255]|uniref:Major facilitator superfamily protein n=1 Tax=Natronolimnohabitans innermongolicus JCM 12255 TaxID=1227499 RepID=L9XHN9_9EURY|nr:major facilitator superfamily protein [Natronolimnohabitans innermongolicus JCM 12255]